LGTSGNLPLASLESILKFIFRSEAQETLFFFFSKSRQVKSLMDIFLMQL